LWHASPSGDPRVTTKKKILLAGETWMSSANHYKGFDQFGSVTFHSGAGPLIEAMQGSEFEIVQMPAHEAVERFPFSVEELSAYAAVMLSDIGSNSLLLHPEVWLKGETRPNRLKVIRDFAKGGGGLVMIGGYLTFQGIDGRARWRRTPVEEALPVDFLPYDDRIEVPDGFHAVVTDPKHPILAGIDGPWPALLGANEVTLKSHGDPHLIARLPDDEGGHPLLVAGSFGLGRTLAWTSDVGPHWLPAKFVAWPGYAKLWRNMLAWVTRGT
jgi:uncharacterized membrane protein